MIKEALSCLLIGAGCCGIAVFSTCCSNTDNKSATLLSGKKGAKQNLITEIKSYGDIEAYGLQNGCSFRIFDESENKNYSLGEFLTTKKETVTNLETKVPKLINDNKSYCGKDLPIVTIFYSNNPKQNLTAEDPKKVFMFKREAITGVK